MIFFVDVFRLPVADAERKVANGIARFIAVLQSGQINKGFECRARLPQGIDCPVKLAFLIVNAADHRFDGAALVQNDNRSLGHVASLVGANGLGQNSVGRLLNMLVKRGVNVNVVFPLADIGIDVIINPVGEIFSALNFV